MAVRPILLFAASLGIAGAALATASAFNPDLWSSPDRRGDAPFREGRFGAAAKAYADPYRRGVALYRAGDFQEAAAAFATVATPDIAYDRGNALVLLGKYDDAVNSYDRALSLRPGWGAAEDNRTVAVARRDRLKFTGGDATGGRVKADTIVFEKGKNSNPGEKTEVAGGDPLTDEELRGLWLRRVQTNPADFLRAKFAFQVREKGPRRDRRLLLLLLAAPDPPARVRVELVPEDGAWVGQRVTLAVTLATPDLFAAAPSFDIPPIPGAVVLPPAGSPVIGSEAVGGTTFTTQRHEFAVYAQRRGVVRIPAFAVRFESNAGFGTPTVQRRVTTGAVSFAAKSPPGAEGLGTAVAARGLRVSDEWNPEPKTPKVGDAFTRTVAVTAADVPGMVFPPLRFDPIGGLAAYPKPPAVTDRTERGELTGRRVEAVTYVCERAGAVAIPDRTLTWFDLDAKVLKTEKLPGRTFDVAPSPSGPAAPSEAPAAPPPASDWWWAAVAGAVSLGAYAAFTRGWPRWVRYRAARAESEPAAFAGFRRACRTPDPHAAFTALLAWLDYVGPMTLDEFAARGGDADLARAVRDLQDRVYARPGSPAGTGWRARELSARAAVARRRLLAAAHAPAAGSLLRP